MTDVTTPPIGAPDEAVEPRRRVALVSYDWSEYCLRLASGLADRADVLLLLGDWHNEDHPELVDERIDFAPFDKPRLRQPVAQWKTANRVRAALEAFRPDVIHVQQGHLWFNGALPFLKAPIVTTIHDPSAHVGDRGGLRTPQFVRNFGFRRADQLIVHSPQMVDAAVDLGLDRERLHVIPLIQPLPEGGGMNESDESEDEEAASPTVLFFGRIWPYKGLEHLIRAEPEVVRACPDVRFVIAGRGESLDRYRALMTDADRYEIHNEYVSPTHRAELFDRATVVVLPYVEATGSGVVAVAAGHAKPVVATTVGGLPSQVDDGVTGLLVPPADPASLAEAIGSLLADPSLARQMGARARRKSAEEWSPAAVAAQTMAVYERALESVESGGR